MINRLMAKKPEERYPSAAHFIEALTVAAALSHSESAASDRTRNVNS